MLTKEGHPRRVGAMGSLPFIYVIAWREGQHDFPSVGGWDFPNEFISLLLWVGGKSNEMNSNFDQAKATV